MEEKKDLGHEPDQAVKAHLVRLMQMGYSQAGRLKLRQGFRSVDQPPTGWCRRYRRGEKLRSSMEDMGIQPNYETLCSNGCELSATRLPRRQVERCKRHCKNNSVSR
jgi:hypothetical protein